MGQINNDCLFGKMLTYYSSLDEITSICEVGTWNGQGSTRCIMAGIQDKPKTLYSIESNKKMFQIASTFWSNAGNPDKLVLLNGVLHKNIMSRDEILNHPFFPKIREHYDLYYTSDVSDLTSSEIVTSFIPEKIDMIVLDGGEFSTYYDWEVLKTKNPTIVALDDTMVIKNHTLLNELKKLKWTVLHEGSDRNGWAILRRSTL